MSEKSHCLSHQSNPVSNSEYLENSKAKQAQTTVQTCLEANVKDCRVRMRFRSDAVPDAVSKLCSNYGVRCSWVANTEKNILSALQSGYPVIAHMGPGIFTKNGHYIVLRGVTADGKILVNDPNSSKRTQMAFPLSTIIKQARRSNSFGVCKPMN